MSLLKEVKEVLTAYNIRPRRRLGQNFLINEEVFSKLVSYASINEDDTILEIGAGFGFLTEYLAKLSKHVIAIEIDSKLIRVLMRRLGGYKNVTILKGNILEMETLPPFNKVVSIPPYSIASPLIFWLLKRKFDCAVLTFQEEFGRRLVASPGTSDYGRLTVAVYYHAEVDLLDFIPKDYFWPTPKVNSVIIRLRPRRAPFYVENEEYFFEFLRAVFTQKNRKMRSAAKVFLREIGVPRKELYEISDIIPFHDRRVRELSPEELALAFNDLYKKVKAVK